MAMTEAEVRRAADAADAEDLNVLDVLAQLARDSIIEARGAE